MRQDMYDSEYQEQDVQKPSRGKVCVIDRTGIAVFGYNFPWLLVVILVIVIGVVILSFINQRNYFNQSVSSIMSSAKQSIPFPTGQLGGLRYNSLNIDL